MKKVEVIQMPAVPAHDFNKTYWVCDTCGKKVSEAPSIGNLKRCILCNSDVCRDCAIMTDFQSLEHNHFWGDYPDYFCPSCWQKGISIIPRIRAAREEEERLQEEWENICKGE